MREFVLDIYKLMEFNGHILAGGYRSSFSKINDKLYPNLIDSQDVLLGDYNDFDFKNKDFINLDGYRSDNFKKNTKDDIVFLGCSQTVGVGVDQSFIWPRKVRDEISPGNNLNNLSLPSASTEEIVYNFFKYCYIYGNPGTVFFLMPDIHRGFEPILELAQLRVMQFYQILEIYCKINNIKLISSTWEIEPLNGLDQSLNDFFDGRFDTFYKINKQKYAQDINDFIEKNSHEKYLLVARDQIHMGIAMHHATAKFMVEKYLNLTSKQE
jgi:hypothetical protein